MSRRFDISVVIPTRERWPVLRATLDALAGQRLEGIDLQVVVVDNGSEDGSWEQLQRTAADEVFPFVLTPTRESASGAGAARNRGVAVAAADLVLFLGDDCRPAGPDLVTGHVAAHREASDPQLGVVGQIDWDPTVGVTPVMAWLEATGKILDYRRLATTPPGPYLFYTGNASLRRELIISADGFDQRFQGYGWEDYELALRLADDGFRLVYRPELRVLHSHRYELGDSLARMRAVGRSAELLNRIHPERQPPPAPRARGLKAVAGRALAPLVTRLRLPAGFGKSLSGHCLRVAHYAAFAQGYGRARLSADHALRGRIQAVAAAPRAAVSVVVPFFGGADAGRALLEELEGLRLNEDDELIVVDNTPQQVVPRGAGRAIVVAAAGEQSSYYARNVGAEHARDDWLLFLDADCRPRPTLLDDYFREPIPDSCGAVAGAVVGLAGQETLVARYARSREHLSQAAHFRHPYKPFGITANLLVRRAAWESVGGFYDTISSGGDADFCWRIQDAGWSLEYRESPLAEHRHRDTLGALVRQKASYAAGRAWIERQHPGSSPRPRGLRRLARCAGAGTLWLASFHPERALFKGLDAVVIGAELGGWLLGNASPRSAARVARELRGVPIAVIADTFPELSETFVTGELAALQRSGRHVRVEAAVRSPRPNRTGARGIRVDYASDDGLLRRARDLGWLVTRHPARSAADLLSRPKWAREEDVRRLRALASRARRIADSGERHLHVHFAATAGLDALRLARLLDLPYSVTAHAYDIFRSPANLREKLEGAAFATTGCVYNVERLREVLGPEHARRLHVVVMGVDAGRFRRRRPYPGGGTVLAVGRLVEKKGFRYLLEAAAELRGSGALDRVVIVGDGPLARELRDQADRLELNGVVSLVGALDSEQVRELLEQADLFALPSVVAADGDRDSMPVVVKEALAMEVPVVATREVGLPEIVRDEWGRLVPTHDSHALAAGIGELLALPPEERAAMGRAGRAFVSEHASVDREAAKLAELVDAALGDA